MRTNLNTFLTLALSILLTHTTALAESAQLTSGSRLRTATPINVSTYVGNYRSQDTNIPNRNAYFRATDLHIEQGFEEETLIVSAQDIVKSDRNSRVTTFILKCEKNICTPADRSFDSRYFLLPDGNILQERDGALIKYIKYE